MRGFYSSTRADARAVGKDVELLKIAASDS